MSPHCIAWSRIAAQSQRDRTRDVSFLATIAGMERTMSKGYLNRNDYTVSPVEQAVVDV